MAKNSGNSSNHILSDIRKLLSSEKLDKNKLLDILNNEELQYSFRIPLTTIIGLAEFIIEDKPYQSSHEDAEIENSLIKIASAGKKLLILPPKQKC